MIFPAPQVRHSLLFPPEQVRQSVWQLEQLDSEALYWFEEQLVQAPAEGWFEFIFPGEHVRQFVEKGPEQVRQEESQLEHVFSEALNWLLEQAEQVPAEGWFALTFVEWQVRHALGFPFDEQVKQEESQAEQVDSVFLAWPEGQSAQEPAEGWFALIWVAEQVKQSDEVAPEQVTQSA